jgi:protein tyrosine phosphatase (PTP) superfamily phosphohydrolase (DUF442 family)
MHWQGFGWTFFAGLWALGNLAAGGGDNIVRDMPTNMGQVTENIYRGGVIADDIRLARLKDTLGIKTVVDLKDDPEKWEGPTARRIGMNYFNIPLSTKRAPSREAVERFLEITTNPDNYPIYVHCQGGRHRTGVMIAVYRMKVDGWAPDKVYAEMLRYKFDKGGFMGMGVNRTVLKAFVYQYYRSLQGI